MKSRYPNLRTWALDVGWIVKQWVGAPHSATFLIDTQSTRPEYISQAKYVMTEVARFNRLENYLFYGLHEPILVPMQYNSIPAVESVFSQIETYQSGLSLEKLYKHKCLPTTKLIVFLWDANTPALARTKHTAHLTFRSKGDIMELEGGNYRPDETEISRGRLAFNFNVNNSD